MRMTQGQKARALSSAQQRWDAASPQERYATQEAPKPDALQAAWLAYSAAGRGGYIQFLNERIAARASKA